MATPIPPYERHIRNFAVATWSIPAFCVLICISYVLRARYALGAWPYYDHPDPKNLNWPVHHLAILVSLLAIYPALICSAVASIYLFFCKCRGLALWILLGTISIYVGLRLLAATSAVDEFFAWYLD